jgi:hypothetical protein
MNARPTLDLKVGDTVLTRSDSGYGRDRVKAYVTGTVTAVKRVYATVEFGVWFRSGDYRLDNGAKRDGEAHLITQAQVEWDAAMNAARQTILDAGFDMRSHTVRNGLILAVAEFLRGVDADGEPID